MNIWVFNNYAITPDMPGGTRHYDFARELSRRGYGVTIFASSFHYSLLEETKSYKSKDFIIDDFEGVRFIWFKTYPYTKNNWKRVVNMLSYSIKAYKGARYIPLERPDIIIGSSVHLFAVYIAYLVSKAYRVPFVMEVRDLWPQTIIDMGVPKWNPFVVFLAILEKFLYKKAKKIITLLPKSHEYIESLGINGGKIAWIPNGVDLERFENNSLKLSRKNRELSSKFTITYTGAMGKANDLEVILQAAEILQEGFPDTKFIFVGDGPEKPRLIQNAREKGLNNVEFKSPVPKDNVARIFSQSSLLLFNLKESPVFKYGISSNKIFDYLASGKPIVFACNAINNPVKDANAGITVSQDNPKEIAEAIVKIYEMPEEMRKKIGQNGRRYIGKYYSIDVLVDKFEKVIKEVTTGD